MAAGEDSDKTFLARAYALRDESSAKALYDEWAASYDGDLDDQGYRSPQLTVEAILQHVEPSQNKISVLDAGCGTGLVAELLAKSTRSNGLVIDGCDLSPGMLQIAERKAVYRSLEVIDLSKPINYADGIYDVVACCGTLTKGHVGPSVLREFVRVAASAALIVATVHGEIWVSGGYEDEVEALRKEGLIRVLSTAQFGITEGTTSGGIMLVMKKRG